MYVRVEYEGRVPGERLKLYNETHRMVFVIHFIMRVSVRWGDFSLDRVPLEFISFWRVA